MNDIRGSKILVIGGAGFIGSHVVDELVKEDVAEIVIYDNFCRGTHDNIAPALKDPRVKVFELGGDILQTDILDEAVKGGARLATGGRRLSETVLEPTVLIDPDPEARISSEEVFGPVVAIYRYSKLDDAIARANSSAVKVSRSSTLSPTPIK